MSDAMEVRLWRLVRSLTPAEKRLFRLQSRVHGSEEKAYVRLFDAIDRPERPDSEGLQREVGDVSDGSYHVLKNYLYRQILRVLRYHSSGSTPSIKVENYLHEVRILREKGLQKDALVPLAKAREIAERWELHAYLLAISSWESLLTSDRSGAALRLDSYRERNGIVDDLREYYELERVVGLLDRELEQGPVPPGSPDRARFDTILEGLPCTPPPADAFLRRSTWHWIRATHAYGTYDLQRCLEEVRVLLEMYRGGGRRVEDCPVDYLGVLGNYLLLLHHLDRTEELLIELKRVPEVTDMLAVRNGLAGNRIHRKGALTIWSREMMIRLDRKEYAETARISREVERAGLTAADLEFAFDRSFLFHLCGIGLMMSGENRRALDWNLRSIEAAPASNSVMVFTARTLELLLHIRLGNRRLVTSLLRTLPRYQPEEEPLRESAAGLVELLRAMGNLGDSTRSRERLRRAMERVTEILKSERGLVVFGHIPWLEVAKESRRHLS